MDKYNKDIMKKITKSLMIDMNDQEEKEIYLRIKGSIEEINKLKLFDLSNVEPMDFPIIEVNNNFREDAIYNFENKEKILNCAKEKRNRYIKV